jgi:hypothetical protein
VAGRIMSMKNSNDIIGNRTRDLPACRAVPQPNVPSRAPQCVVPYLKFRRKNYTQIKKLEQMSVNEQMGTEDSNHTLRLPQNYHMINTKFVVLIRMDKNAKLLQAVNLTYFLK